MFLSILYIKKYWNKIIVSSLLFTQTQIFCAIWLGNQQGPYTHSNNVDIRNLISAMNKRKKQDKTDFQAQSDDIKQIMYAIEERNQEKFDELIEKVNISRPYLFKIKYIQKVQVGGIRKVNIIRKRILPFLALRGWHYGFTKAFSKIQTANNFDINAQDENGVTLLMHAAFAGYLNIVKYLVNQSTKQNPIDFFIVATKQISTFHTDHALARAFVGLEHTIQGYGKSIGLTGNQHVDIINLLAEKMLAKTIADKDLDELKKLIFNNNLLVPRLKNYLQIRFKKNQVTPAGWIAGSGWLEGLIQLMKGISNIDERQDGSGRTLLMLGAAGGKLPIVKELVRRGAWIALEDDDNWTALTHAARHGRRNIVDFLVKNGFNQDKKNYQDHWNDALFYAVHHGHISVVEVLLELQKAKMVDLTINTITFKDEEATTNEKTTLIEAIQQGYVTIVSILLNALKKGEEIKTDKNGRGPIMYAVQCNQVEILRYLVDINNPLIITKIQKKIIKDIDQKDNTGKTAFMYAAYHGYTDMGEILIEAGANINLKDNEEWTSTMYASMNGHVDFLKKMYEVSTQSIDINALSETRHTALIYAIVNNQRAIVKFLLEKGANVLISDDQERNVLLHTCRHGHVKILMDLLKLESNPVNHVVEEATSKEQVTVTNDLNEESSLEKFRQQFIYCEDKEKRTALMIGIANGHIGIVKALIEQEKKDYSAEEAQHQWSWHKKDNKHCNIINYAAVYGHNDILSYLLDPQNNLDLDINNQNDEGETPLIQAAKGGYKKITELLVNANASLNQEDNHGKDALGYALAYHHFNVANLLYKISKKKRVENPSMSKMEKFMQQKSSHMPIGINIEEGDIPLIQENSSIPSEEDTLSNKDELTSLEKEIKPYLSQDQGSQQDSAIKQGKKERVLTALDKQAIEVVSSVDDSVPSENSFFVNSTTDPTKKQGSPNTSNGKTILLLVMIIGSLLVAVISQLTMRYLKKKLVKKSK
ncbi:MAG: ankyrin repeat domain-containing protein [Bacteroidota bacterium]